MIEFPGKAPAAVGAASLFQLRTGGRRHGIAPALPGEFSSPVKHFARRLPPFAARGGKGREMGGAAWFCSVDIGMRLALPEA